MSQHTNRIAALCFSTNGQSRHGNLPAKMFAGLEIDGLIPDIFDSEDIGIVIVEPSADWVPQSITDVPSEGRIVSVCGERVESEDYGSAAMLIVGLNYAAWNTRNFSRWAVMFQHQRPPQAGMKIGRAKHVVPVW